MVFIVNEYWDNMLDKVHKFKTEEEALKFFHVKDQMARRTYYVRFEYIGNDDEMHKLQEEVMNDYC